MIIEPPPVGLRIKMSPPGSPERFSPPGQILSKTGKIIKSLPLPKVCYWLNVHNCHTVLCICVYLGWNSAQYKCTSGSKCCRNRCWDSTANEIARTGMQFVLVCVLSGTVDGTSYFQAASSSSRPPICPAPLTLNPKLEAVSPQPPISPQEKIVVCLI